MPRFGVYLNTYGIIRALVRVDAEDREEARQKAVDVVVNDNAPWFYECEVEKDADIEVSDMTVIEGDDA